MPAGVTYKSYNSDIAVNPMNEQELVFCMSQGASGNKVFMSIDGGATWVNYTGFTLANESIGYIQWQGGTNAGIYAIGVSSTARAFYRDATMTDWVDYGLGLPNNVNASRGAQLFYRDNKLRISGNRGFWETPLYAQGLPQAMPMSNKQYVSCSKDTVVFKDYSILNYAGASWNWSFPGASYVSSTTASEVKVTYPGPGNYSVSLTVTDAASHSNTTSITDMISFTTNNCPLDSFPGKALRLPYDGVYYSIGTANINSNSFTISCWIRPDGLQQSFAQLIAHDAYPGSSYGFGLGFAFDGYNPNLKLCYTSKESGYWNATSAKPDTARWNHVALLYEPNNVFIYLNGVRYTANSGTMPVVDLSQSPFYINKDIHNQGGKYKGEIDEIKIFNYALSQNEIREKMHLIDRTGLSETGLLKYVQFNIMDASTSSVYELMDGTPVSLSSSSVLVNSAAPVGAGTSYRKTVSTGGQHTFTGTGAQLFLPAAAGSTYPNGEVVAFRLSSLPTDLPDAPNAVHMGERFIFNNYGTNAIFTAPDSIRFEGVTLPAGHDVAFGYKLFKVASGKLSTTDWGTSLGTGITLSRTSSTTGHLSFAGTGITSFSQFVAAAPTGTNAWVGTTGGWSTASSWSNGTRPTGTTDIEVNTGIPTLDVDFTLPAGKTFSMGGTGSLVVAPGKTLTIGGTADLGGRPVTFRSDATGTAQFGPMTGTLTGATNVTVERYLPARRAYRLMSSAVSTVGSIRANWMENATPGQVSGYPYTVVSANNPSPGYGTQITGTGGSVNGFDATVTNNPSMFTFDHSTQTWSAVTSTSGMLTSGAAYRMFIRGDRGIHLGQSSPTPSATILRSTGSLVTGTQSPTALSSTANGWTMVGNPYQSVVDMTAVTRNNLSDYYYIWDPNLGSRGAYVAYNLTSRISSNGASAMNQYLQPGQAFFVQTATTGSTQLQFTEAAKGAATEQTATQGIAATGQRLSIMLSQRDSLVKGGIPVDGLRVIFGAGHQNEVDGRDAMKMTNSDEGMSIDRGGRLLCMEFRAPYDSSTVIPLNVAGYTKSQYLLKLSWEGNVLGSSVVSAWLEDRHLGTRTPIDPASASVVEIPFTVGAGQPGSAASDRFRVVFGRSNVGIPVVPTIDQSSVLRIAPNPVEGGMIRLRVSGLSEGFYELRLIDLNGRVLEQRQFRSNGQPGVWNWRPERPWGSGTYLLECRSGEQRFIFKFIKP